MVPVVAVGTVTATPRWWWSPGAQAGQPAEQGHGQERAAVAGLGRGIVELDPEPAVRAVGGLDPLAALLAEELAVAGSEGTWSRRSGWAGGHGGVVVVVGVGGALPGRVAELVGADPAEPAVRLQGGEDRLGLTGRESRGLADLVRGRGLHPGGRRTRA
jgi:hypothetical protein